MAKQTEALSEHDFNCVAKLLTELVPEDSVPEPENASPATIYTRFVTFWLCTLQRLKGGASLAFIMTHLVAHGLALLPDNKRIREGRLSSNSGAFGRARGRLPVAVVRTLADQVSRSLIEQSAPWFDDRRAFIIDGTTITLAPTSPLREVYPPAVNQLGESVWPVMLLTVAHEVQSGCCLVPEFGAMYGPNNTSEAKQAANIAGRLPAGSLILADSGFGIFSVAHAMTDAGHKILFRLTTTRFIAMVKNAELVEETRHSACYKLTWIPSAKDRKANPDLPADASIEVFLHKVRLDNNEWLYLVTTLEVTSQVAAKFYLRRYDIEHDIRDMKVTLGVENIRAKSDEMVQKELICSVVAYNLVNHVRRKAAKLAKVQPRELSFTGVWNVVRTNLIEQAPCAPKEWKARYETALRAAATKKLPKRKQKRDYPRKALPRRPKSTKFMKEQARTKAKAAKNAEEIAQPIAK